MHQAMDVLPPALFLAIHDYRGILGISQAYTASRRNRLDATSIIIFMRTISCFTVSLQL